MTTYRHLQVSMYSAAMLVAVAVYALWALLSDDRALVVTQLPVAVFAAALLILFGLMTVEVTDTELIWSFALGFWRKRITRTDIATAQMIRLPWWIGSGIRYFRRGWGYLVGLGGPAVEIRLKDGTLYFIGTDDPAGLAAALGIAPLQDK